MKQQCKLRLRSGGHRVTAWKDEISFPKIYSRTRWDIFWMVFFATIVSFVPLFNLIYARVVKADHVWLLNNRYAQILLVSYSLFVSFTLLCYAGVIVGLPPYLPTIMLFSALPPVSLCIYAIFVVESKEINKKARKAYVNLLRLLGLEENLKIQEVLEKALAAKSTHYNSEDVSSIKDAFKSFFKEEISTLVLNYFDGSPDFSTFFLENTSEYAEGLFDFIKIFHKYKLQWMFIFEYLSGVDSLYYIEESDIDNSLVLDEFISNMRYLREIRKASGCLFFTDEQIEELYICLRNNRRIVADDRNNSDLLSIIKTGPKSHIKGYNDYVYNLSVSILTGILKHNSKKVQSLQFIKELFELLYQERHVVKQYEKEANKEEKEVDNEKGDDKHDSKVGGGLKELRKQCCKQYYLLCKNFANYSDKDLLGFAMTMFHLNELEPYEEVLYMLALQEIPKRAKQGHFTELYKLLLEKYSSDQHNQSSNVSKKIRKIEKECLAAMFSHDAEDCLIAFCALLKEGPSFKILKDTATKIQNMGKKLEELIEVPDDSQSNLISKMKNPKNSLGYLRLDNYIDKSLLNFLYEMLDLNALEPYEEVLYISVLDEIIKRIEKETKNITSPNISIKEPEGYLKLYNLLLKKKKDRCDNLHNGESYIEKLEKRCLCMLNVLRAEIFLQKAEKVIEDAGFTFDPRKSKALANIMLESEKLINLAGNGNQYLHLRLNNIKNSAEKILTEIRGYNSYQQKESEHSHAFIGNNSNSVRVSDFKNVIESPTKGI